MKALGIHVFAGGFTYGAQQAGIDVVAQLESHNFGVATVEQRWGVPVENCAPSRWPRIEADIILANPRCTGFSCVTAGLSEDAHGANAKQCQDIHDLVTYALADDAHQYPIVMFESVQQAFTASGRPLMEALAERFISTGRYRVAHVLCTAYTFGCPQSRKRYFFVAHPRELSFNVAVPEISPYYAVLYDAIWDQRDRETHEVDYRSTDYDRDSYICLTEGEKEILPMLAVGHDLNRIIPRIYDRVQNIDLKDRWDFRLSEMPFSMHGVYRTSWKRPCPTMKNSSGRLVHPWHHRPFTYGELALCMGWTDEAGQPILPVGTEPVGQLAKGVVPSVGKWILEQAAACLNNEWGDDDWALKYDHHKGEFIGHDAREQDQKVIDVTQYRGWQYDDSRFPDEVHEQIHHFNVNPGTGRPVRPWKIPASMER